MDEHNHSVDSVCEGLRESVEDEMGAFNLYHETSVLLRECAMGDDTGRQCPSGMSDHQMLHMAEEIRKIDEEERTHGYEFIQMVEEAGCATQRELRDYERQMSEM